MTVASPFERLARNTQAEVVEMRDLLSALDHTLALHGKVDADTALHRRIRVALNATQ